MMSVVLRRSEVRRALVFSAFAGGLAFALAFWSTRQHAAKTRAVLDSAVERLAALTDTNPPEQSDRTAIAWGYGARLRFGLESPFRLIEAASRDPRLTIAERQTVSWALLGRVLRGEMHVVDPASLDLIGPWDRERSVPGEQHLAVIERSVRAARDPRAAELGVRLAYSLAAAERIVDGSAPLLAAEVAALVADRELAQREANVVVRASRGADPIDVVRTHRARRSFYVERPVLLQPDQELERAAIQSSIPILASLRSMRAVNPPGSDSLVVAEDAAPTFAASVLRTGARLPPNAALAVTVQRYMPVLRAHVPRAADGIARARNGEMLVGAVQVTAPTRAERRAVGRMLLAASIAARTSAQDRVWFEGDSTHSATQVVATLGLSTLEFDADVPPAWRPYYLQSFTDGIEDLRRILPALRLEGLTVRFRMRAPTDSALAMHDPRTRTLHLPVVTAAGTLVHELAHDIDRQSARQQNLAGYRSDHVARVGAALLASARTPTRLAASLQALNEELSESSGMLRSRQDRPAEVFATRVDWFVATSLARRGRSSGFLSAVQDELLTGHVVHPTRLRASGSTRSLVTALQGMTGVAPFATADQEPSAQTLLRWALASPVDRRVAAMIVRGDREPWQPIALSDASSCEVEGRASLLRLAAESRARGWLRQRARWTSTGDRRPWARSMLDQPPWGSDAAMERVGQLRDHILAQMATGDLPSGLTAFAAPIAAMARCRS